MCLEARVILWFIQKLVIVGFNFKPACSVSWPVISKIHFLLFNQLVLSFVSTLLSLNSKNFFFYYHLLFYCNCSAVVFLYLSAYTYIFFYFNMDAIIRQSSVDVQIRGVVQYFIIVSYKNTQKKKIKKRRMKKCLCQ